MALKDTDKKVSEIDRRVRDLEETLSTYRTAAFVAGAIFTGVLGWSAKNAYDAVSATLDPITAANEQATTLLDQMQIKRDQLDGSIETLIETRTVRIDEEVSAGASEIASLLEVAERDFGDLQAIGDFGVEVRQVLAVNHENEGKETGHYFTLDSGSLREIIVAEIQTSEADHASLLVLNIRTGRLANVVIWSNIRDFHSAGDVHGRYAPYGATSGDDWRIGDELIFFVGDR